eukprot:m.270769 g.270769  ORF g.270769 m.270769 type:complete len:929 (+) comp19742_c0_seq1:127-2913(+)
MDDSSEVVIGTPVDIPTEEEGRKKPVPVQDQVATDVEGRRRFHGAFTGGFSAGYFNSVGSAQGWAPTTFKSSRATGTGSSTPSGRNTTPRFQQSVEDFMDDEDRSDVGFAPQRVTATETFEDKVRANGKGQAPVVEGGALAGATLPDLVIPTDSTIGVQLLRMMGWREGQGVGPRRSIPSGLRRTSKRKRHLHMVDAHSRISQSDDGDDSDSDSGVSGRTFAPHDVSIDDFNAKDNLHGIGYHGMSAADFQLDAASTGGEGAKSGGFGVGALEEEDDDVYDHDTLDNYDRTLGETEATSTAAPPHRHVFRSKRGHVDVSARDATVHAVSNVFLDNLGMVTLRGFRLGAQRLSTVKVYPAPPLPRAFNPFHVFSDAGPAFRHASSVQSQAHNLTADQRSALLGEAKLPGPNKSVFDYLKPADRARLQGIKAASVVPATQVPDAVPPPEVPQPVVHRPLSAAMASRFVRASTSLGPDARAEAERTTSALETAKKAAQDARDNAVDMKLFGALTRTSYEWHPVALLCKRFDVPDPYPKSALTGVVGRPAGARHKFSTMPLPTATIKSNTSTNTTAALPVRPEDYGLAADAMDHTPLLATALGGAARQDAQGSAASDSNPAPARAAEDAEPELRDTRPAMDIFKAIFSDSSDDDDPSDAPAPAGQNQIPDGAAKGTQTAGAPTIPGRDMSNSHTPTSSATPERNKAVMARHDADLPPEAPIMPRPFFPGAPPAPPPIQNPPNIPAQRTPPHATPPSAPAPSLKLDLVHTYSAIAAPATEARRVAGVRHTYGDASMDVPDAEPQWVEKAAAGPARPPSRHKKKGKDRKDRKDKKDKRDKRDRKTSRKDRKKKDKKAGKSTTKTRSRRLADGSASSSSDTDDEEQTTDAALLAKMRAVRGTVLPKASGVQGQAVSLPARPRPPRHRPSAADMFT